MEKGKANWVAVLDKHKKPLMPCHPARARQLLSAGRAVVHKRFPFTIRLKDRVSGGTQPLTLKLDPGSKTTGIALLREERKVDKETGEVAHVGHVLHMAELHHKQGIPRAMKKRSQARRRRRSAKLRHRPPRFNNRRKEEGRLPPSLEARVDNAANWVERYRRLFPITHMSLELAKFDTQKLENPEISGVEYQQGELQGYEVKQYLLQKWGHACAYCGRQNVPLEIEHIIPKSRGGTDRVSNLTIACRDCNVAKGNRTAAEFGHPEVQEEARKPFKDAAAMNATRWALYRRLKGTGLPLEVGTGGRTKWNRARLGLPKSHPLDALCVGASTPDRIEGLEGLGVFIIKAEGRGKHKRTNFDKYGFPRGYLMRKKMVYGFQTGDMVKALVPKGKYKGVYEGAVSVRKSGYFDIKSGGRRVAQGISHRHCRLLQRFDGYSYEWGGPALPPHT